MLSRRRREARPSAAGEVGRGTARVASPTVTDSASGRTRSIAPQFFGIAAVIEIKSVINVALAADGLVIVVALGGRQALESFGDGLEAGRFGRQVGSPGIGAAHDGRYPFDG